MVVLSGQRQETKQVALVATTSSFSLVERIVESQERPELSDLNAY